jgi:hypothetical protein
MRRSQDRSGFRILVSNGHNNLRSNGHNNLRSNGHNNLRSNGLNSRVSNGCHSLFNSGRSHRCPKLRNQTQQLSRQWSLDEANVATQLETFVEHVSTWLFTWRPTNA